MLFTTHSVVGAAIGAAAGNPYAGFFAGFFSHHLMDALPHFDQGSFRTATRRAPYLGDSAAGNNTVASFGRRDWIMLFIDWVVSLILFSIIFIYASPDQWSLIIIGALGGVFPDIIDSSPLWSPQLHQKNQSARRYYSFHSFFHWTVPAKSWPFGLLFQLLFISASLWYLIL